MQNLLLFTRQKITAMIADDKDEIKWLEAQIAL